VKQLRLRVIQARCLDKYFFGDIPKSLLLVEHFRGALDVSRETLLFT
jgi:hypothetical protein